MGIESRDWIITQDDPVLVTGAAGFVGARVVENLLARGFINVKCFVRAAGGSGKLDAIARRYPAARLQIVQGNLLSREDCVTATRGVAVIYHLATGRGDMFADAFLNSVVTTRNLIEASLD